MNRSTPRLAATPVPTPGLPELAAELAPIAQAVRSPLPLFVTAAAAVWAGEHTGQAVQLTLAYTLFAYLLSLLAYIDLRHGILPHLLTGTLATLGVVLAPGLGLALGGSTLGAVAAFAGLGLCALFARLATGKDALGGGDLWLVFALGAWLGVAGLPMLLAATALTGCLSVLVRRWLTAGYPEVLLARAGQGVPPGSFPFGPALCAAGWLALLYGADYWKFIALLVPPAA